MKDEAIQIFLMELNKYKCIIVQTFQSQVQDSVENNKHMRKHKIKLTMSQKVLLPLINLLAQKLLQKKFSKKKLNQHDCQKLRCWYVHKTPMPTSNDVINKKDIPRFTC